MATSHHEISWLAIESKKTLFQNLFLKLIEVVANNTVKFSSKFPNTNNNG